MSKPVILTGLRANNDLHIGNYLGALLPMVDMAKQKAGEYQVNLFVPDLHSFTTPIDHRKLQGAILNNLRVYAAAGLPIDDENVHIYRQSYIPAHSELTWVLDCFTGFGEMRRMTQFKDKAELREIQPIQNVDSFEETPAKLEEISTYLQKQDRVSVGLFNYPILMAADILLYDAVFVPVGDDQTQHLEFTRDIAERMNNRFGDIFTVPKAVKEQHEFFGKDQGLRVKDLQDPSKKMSKSDETGKGVIFLTDHPVTARKKIMSAVTDDLGKVSYDPAKQPGIANLVDIYQFVSGGSEKWKVYLGTNEYGNLKGFIADEVTSFLTDFQTKLAAVDDAKLLKKLEQSEKLMNEQANKTLLKVQKAVGLR